MCQKTIKVVILCYGFQTPTVRPQKCTSFVLLQPVAAPQWPTPSLHGLFSRTPVLPHKQAKSILDNKTHT